MSATDTQIGGDHYRTCKIQPIEFIEAMRYQSLTSSAGAVRGQRPGILSLAGKSSFSDLAFSPSQVVESVTSPSAASALNKDVSAAFPPLAPVTVGLEIGVVP